MNQVYEVYEEANKAAGILYLVGVIVFILFCVCLSVALKHTETPDTLQVFNGVDRAEVVGRWTN